MGALTEAEFTEMRDRMARNASPMRATRLTTTGLSKPCTASLHRTGMNQWETEYSFQLEAMRLVGEILWWKFEPMKLRLAGKTYYTPDFGVVLPDQRQQFIEVKGFWRDDAVVKFKVAAEAFPLYRFTAIRKKRAKEGGGWEVLRDLNV